MDRIILIDQGKIIADGTYQELSNMNEHFKDYIKHIKTMESDQGEGGQTKGQSFQRIESSAIIKKAVKDANKIVSAEKAQQGRVKLSHYIYFIRKAGIGFFGFILISYVLSEVAMLGSSILLSHWSDAVDASEKQFTKQEHLAFVQYLAIFIVVSMVALLSRTMCTYLRAAVAGKAIHNRALEGLFHSPMSFFDTNPSGRILNRFSSDVDVLDLKLPNMMEQILKTSMNLSTVLVLVVWYTPAVLFLFVPIMTIAIVIQILFARTQRQLKRLEAINKSPIFAHFSETIQGTSSIRAYQVENR